MTVTSEKRKEDMYGRRERERDLWMTSESETKGWRDAGMQGGVRSDKAWLCEEGVERRRTTTPSVF